MKHRQHSRTVVKGMRKSRGRRSLRTENAFTSWSVSWCVSFMVVCMYEYICIYIYIYVCVYVCICIYVYVHTHIYIYTYICLHTCVSVCVCVCVCLPASLSVSYLAQQLSCYWLLFVCLLPSLAGAHAAHVTVKKQLGPDWPVWAQFFFTATIVAHMI